MALAGPARRPPPVEHSFPAAAWMGYAAQARRRHLAPADAVVRLFPQMIEYEGIALAGVPCGESVLRLALTLVHPDRDDEQKVLIHLNTGVPPGGLTVDQMIRRLRRMRAQGVGDFPVCAVKNMGANVRFVLLHGKPRNDNYAITYIPRDEFGAAFPPVAHYTFMQVDEFVPNTFTAPPVGQRVMVFTRMPVQTSVEVYWRCQPTPETLALFAESERRGEACSCCHEITCVHEIAWLARNPRGKRVSLYPDHMLEGIDRGVVEEKNAPPGWTVSIIPDQGVAVVQPNGNRSWMPRVYRRYAMINVSYLLGFLPAGALSSMEKRYYRVKSAFGWVCENIACTFKNYELPSHQEDLIVPPYVVRAFEMKRTTALERTASRVRRVGVVLGSAWCAWFAWAKRGTLALIEAAEYTERRPVQYMSWTETLFRWVHGLPAPKGWTQPWNRMKARVARLYLTHVKEYNPVKYGLRTESLLPTPQGMVKTMMNLVEQDYYEVKLPEPFFDYCDRWWANVRIRLMRAVCMGLVVGLGVLMLRRVLSGMQHRYQRIYTDKTQMGFASRAGLDLALPRVPELVSRFALMKTPTEADVVDRIRRVCNEERWPAQLERDEVQTWIERIVSEPGQMMIPPNETGFCVTCRQKKPTRWQECKQCQRDRRMHPPDGINYHDTVVRYTGRLGLWSRRAEFPQIEVKKDMRVKFGNRVVTTVKAVREWYEKQPAVATCRGWTSGPTFVGHVPECFPRGEATAVLAFVIRMGRARDHEAQQWLYDLLYALVESRIEPLEPEPRDLFLSHFTGEKLARMLEAEETIRQGLMRIEPGVLKCKGFTKAEKSLSTEYIGGCHMKKAARKPRIICSPDPTMLRLVGPYTHRQTKWLAEAFRCDSRLFYAGCATPEQCDTFLNNSLRDCPDMYVFVDDITAIDANHSEKSYAFHKRVRREQYASLPLMIEQLWDAFCHLSMRIGSVGCSVDDVNPSGVPDTSYKNSFICLFVRVLAIVSMIVDLSTLSLAEAVALVELVLELIYTTASGDDGYSRVPEYLLGVKTTTKQARDRYEACWAAAGFGVKLAVLPPQRWRMATYLAARPTWSGEKYVWTPEPARRLKMGWWQIDSGMHPTAWGRGIATQLAMAGSCNPVIRPIAEWYLENTKGPTAKVTFTDNPYSPWVNRTKQYSVTPRAVEEFCLDYRVTRREYDRFLGMLASVKSVYVDIGGHLMEQVFAEES